MLQELPIGDQLVEDRYGNAEMIDPDRGVDNDHQDGRSRGGTFKSGIVPPNAMS